MSNRATSDSLAVLFSPLRLVGSSSAPSVSQHIHKDLSVQADQLSQLVGDFGTTCEKLLLTYRKNIIRKSSLDFPKFDNHQTLTMIVKI